jgi:ABC-type sugar transport system permease subunit
MAEKAVIAGKPKKTRKRKGVTLEAQNARAGRLFVLPWIIGFILFFARPLVESIIYTFSFLSLTDTGLKTTFIGLENYKNAFGADVNLMPMLGKSIASMLVDMPLIIFFSLFIAVLINQKFKGRAIVRSAFFLPVIITSGALIYVLNQDLGNTLATGEVASKGIPMIQTVDFKIILLRLTNSIAFVQPIIDTIDRVYIIIWKSGVQILLFLAGLQSISPSLYECAEVEGAAPWESFWKITFPMISPIIIVNVVYTMIDSFTDYNNQVLRYILDLGFTQIKYGYSATVAWIYFIVVFLLLLFSIGIISKKVFYMNE